MRLPISLSLLALWTASYVVGKGPSGPKTSSALCESFCPPGVSCPANDGCFMHGRANMSAEAEERCSSTVESVVAAEQTSCAARNSAEQTSCISAQQSSCAASISAQQTSCATSISSAIASAASSVSSAQQTSCAASISAEQTNCISAQQSSCTASISSAIASAASSVSSALTQCQAAAASAGLKCGVLRSAYGWYQDLRGHELERCRAWCLVDSRCLSYSTHRTGSAGACYLYEKVVKDLTPISNPGFVIYDRNCPLRE